MGVKKELVTSNNMFSGQAEVKIVLGVAAIHAQVVKTFFSNINSMVTNVALLITGDISKVFQVLPGLKEFVEKINGFFADLNTIKEIFNAFETATNSVPTSANGMAVSVTKKPPSDAEWDEYVINVEAKCDGLPADVQSSTINFRQQSKLLASKGRSLSAAFEKIAQRQYQVMVGELEEKIAKDHSSR